MDLTTPVGLGAYLENSKYAAADIQILSGGTMGFTYRVRLESPLPNGETSVVVKHSADYASSDDGANYGAERMDFEHEALKMIASSPLFSSTSTVQVPRVFEYDSDTHTLIMADLAPTRMLSAVLIECLESGNEERIRQISSQIGFALGDFLGRFHYWTSLPEQRALRERFLKNTPSSEKGLEIQYELVLATAAKLGLRRVWMEEIVDKGLRDARRGGSVIAMADFWFNNILVSEDPTKGLRLYIIDWEMARCARPELDVGIFAMVTHSVAYSYKAGDSFQLIQEFYKSYCKHYALDEVHVGMSGAIGVLSFGLEAPWVVSRGQRALEAIARAGFQLLEAVQQASASSIRTNPIVKNMYAADIIDA
ncbi:hypothetical protein BDV93DRAFT_553937 [Ceratobasidium sp. AG-I]|nr:hypothetical protein BDV93DRAFT_553937 [Ceratobasidium sp. AG-I]